MFGDRPQLPALPKERRADAGDARAQFIKRVMPTPTPDTVKLPQTATDAEPKMMSGVFLLTLSLMLLAFNRRQRFAR